MRDQALERVFEALGGQARLAEALAISPQAVSQWERVPVERALEIERLTGISRHELRADIYPIDNPPPPSDRAIEAA